MNMLGILLILLAINITACGSKNSGKVGDAPLLITLENGQTITICGAHDQLIADAITKWGAAIKRSYNIVLTCGVKTPTVRSFASTDPVSIKVCREMSATNHMFTEYASSLNIYDCEKKAELLPSTILHEAGHLFGLCDQYFTSNLPHCSQQPTMGLGSVMFTGNSVNLSRDDINGIRVLMALNPIAGEGSLVAPKNGYYISADESKTYYLEAHISGRITTSVTLFWVGGESEYHCTNQNFCVSTTEGSIMLDWGKNFTHYDTRNEPLLFTRQ
jgi:hypothetical protein